MREETVLFVCLRGAAKSLIAASHLERLAREQGIIVYRRAVARDAGLTLDLGG